MDNRGFTLIELIAVIVVLVTIFLVSFPAILNMSKEEEETKYQNMVEDLCLAGKSYIYANMDSYEELTIVGSTINIKISELISYGNIDEDMENVKTRKSIKKDSLTYRVLGDYSLDCQYNESK